MLPTCLVCLDPIKENPAPNPIGCQCRVHMHPACFQQWFEQKQQIECPICHTVSVPNRLAYDNIHIVYIQMAPDTSQERSFRTREKYMAACCCGLLLWTLVLVILDSVYQS